MDPTNSMPNPPHYEQSPDPDTVPQARVTLDEFIPYGAHIRVQKIKSRSENQHESNIWEAVKYTSGGKHQFLYTFSLCDHPDLDMDIKLPNYVSNNDLFTKYWVSKEASTYLRPRGKMFSAYNKGYESAPQIVYGGLSKWIKLSTGKLIIKLYKPTRRNVANCMTTDKESNFIPEEQTMWAVPMRPGSLIVIPGGWIMVQKALRATYAFCGEFLDKSCSRPQLVSFERDIVETSGCYGYERDREIRTLYWLMAARLANKSKNNEANHLKLRENKFLIELLREWRTKSNNKLPANIYAPTGLLMQNLLDDLRPRSRDTTKEEIKAICY